MQQLITDLFTYSRVETHSKPFEPVDCNGVFVTVVQNLRMAIEEHKAKVTHDPLPVVLADNWQIVQLLQNLIANGIKFHREETPMVHLSAQRRGNEWLFSVRDNGIGIPNEFLEKIFVIFQRLKPRGTYPGTGIGLAICKKIIERHGGRIWTDSEPGKGSTFCFTLPAAQVSDPSLKA